MAIEGKRVMEAREALKWTQSELAAALKVTKSWVNKLEHGKRPSKIVAAMLVHVLRTEAERRATDQPASERMKRQVRRLRALAFRIEEEMDA